MISQLFKKFKSVLTEYLAYTTSSISDIHILLPPLQDNPYLGGGEWGQAGSVEEKEDSKVFKFSFKIH